MVLPMQNAIFAFGFHETGTEIRCHLIGHRVGCRVRSGRPAHAGPGTRARSTRSGRTGVTGDARHCMGRLRMDTAASAPQYQPGRRDGSGGAGTATPGRGSALCAAGGPISRRTLGAVHAGRSPAWVGWAGAVRRLARRVDCHRCPSSPQNTIEEG